MTKQPFRSTQAPQGVEPGPTQALVQRLLQKYGLSQGAVMRATGVDQSRLSRYSRGIVPPACDDVFKLQELERQMEAKAKEAAAAPAAG